MSGIPYYYAQQYWEDMDAELARWNEDYLNDAPEETEAYIGEASYLERTYTGAPDECNKHYPENLNSNFEWLCPEDCYTVQICEGDLDITGSYGLGWE